MADDVTVGARFVTRQGYAYEVTAVGRWYFLAMHEGAMGTEYVFHRNEWENGRCMPREKTEGTTDDA